MSPSGLGCSALYILIYYINIPWNFSLKVKQGTGFKSMVFRPHSQNTKINYFSSQEAFKGYIHNDLQLTHSSIGLSISLALSKHAEPRKLYILSDNKTISIQQRISSRKKDQFQLHMVEWKQFGLLNLHQVKSTAKIPL
jgi:hypothetical protein